MDQHDTIPNLQGKRILLGITGGIAAYKSADLARRLMETGAEVRVVMSSSAQSFITPLTLQALTGNPVHTDLLDETAEAAMGHIELARWADLILIAPATANTLARMAHGFADDLLSTLYLATDKPVMVAPAMNRLMWSSPATTTNISILKQHGVTVVGPDSGLQACGETGAGRMLDPLDIREAVAEHLISQQAKPLAGVAILITAGPTREAIDPVRYMSNRSSGKMGYEVARAAEQMGADVTLVSGPVNLSAPPRCKVVNATSARDMLEAVLAQVSEHQIFISVAAVADYRVASEANNKIKKSDEVMTLSLVRNPDILATVSALENRPFCVGFAAETQDVENYARSKMKKKNLDMIAANHVAQEDNAVFGTDTNALAVYWPEDGFKHIPNDSKRNVAVELMALITEQYFGARKQ